MFLIQPYVNNNFLVAPTILLWSVMRPTIFLWSVIFEKKRIDKYGNKNNVHVIFALWILKGKRRATAEKCPKVDLIFFCECVIPFVPRRLRSLIGAVCMVPLINYSPPFAVLIIPSDKMCIVILTWACAVTSAWSVFVDSIIQQRKKNRRTITGYCARMDGAEGICICSSQSKRRRVVEGQSCLEKEKSDCAASHCAQIGGTYYVAAKQGAYAGIVRVRISLKWSVFVLIFFRQPSLPYNMCDSVVSGLNKKLNIC